MKVIRGPLKDHQLKMHQYANDWVTVDVLHCPLDDDGDGNCRYCARVSLTVINPLNIELDNAEEAQEWKAHDITTAGGGSAVGFFWNVYQLGEDRRFHLKERHDPKEQN